MPSVFFKLCFSLLCTKNAFIRNIHKKYTFMHKKNEKLLKKYLFLCVFWLTYAKKMYKIEPTIVETTNEERKKEKMIKV